MASAKFLEEALSTDVDESAVSAIVGSLENQLEGGTPKVEPGGSGGSGNVKIVSSVSFPACTSAGLQGLSAPTFIASHESQIQNGSGAVLHSSANKPMQPSLVLKQGANLPAGMVTLPMSANTTTIPGMMTLTKPINQNVSSHSIVGTGPPTILPANVQILNVRPPAATVAAQKTVAAVSPRVVIGTPQMMSTRAAAPGITLQTLQGLQPGQQGHLLLKTENGQYQLLRVGPAPSQTTLTQPNQGIRLTTAPTQQGGGMSGPNVSAVTGIQQTSGIPSNATQMVVGGSQVQMAQQMTNQQPQMSVGPATVQAVVQGPQTPVQPTPAAQQSQKASDNTKEKCRNFLANLLDLSSREPKSVERNVRNLIQELIDMRVEAEEFCDRLERLLNASPQPCLIGFLKKSLPLLRQSLVTKELIIEGIQPPPAHVAFAPQTHQIQQQIIPPQPQMMIGSQPTMVNQQPTILQQQIIQPQILQSQMMQSQIPSQTLSGPPIARPVNNTLRANLTPASSPPASIIMAGASNVPQLRALQNQQSHLSQQTQMSQKSQLSQPSQQSQHTQSFTPAAKSIPGPSTQASTSSAPPAMSKAAKEKEKKQAAQTAAFFGDIDKMAGDDDINDVAAMGGVNLAEESQRILGSTEQIGTQIRSCKDEYFASLGPMLTRCKTISAANGLEEPPPEVAALVSHAVQDRIKTLVEKLACIAEHRTEIVKNELQYEVTQDVKGQLRFLESIDRVERKKREDLEREVLLRAAKSRSKSEDPEQAKLKAKAKEMQRAEMEEMRQREANLTALQAIGPRKKTKADEAIPSTSSDVNMTGPSGSDGAAGTSGTSRERPAQRARVKRINYRDLLHLLEQEPSTRRSTFLYKAYLRTPSK